MSCLLMLLRLLPNQVTHDNMAENVRAKALYDFDAQPGTGELSIQINEILTVSRRDVGEGWWEGVNSHGQSGLFPADYVEIISSPPPSIPPPPLPEDYDDQSHQQQQGAYDANDDWDDDWDDDDDSVVSSQDHQSQIEGSFPISSISNKHSSEANNLGRGVGDASGRATVKRSYNRFSTFVKSGGEAYILGQSKISVPPEKCINILENDGQIMWSPSSSPYTCTVTSPKKETKLRGLKSFIAYQLTPSFNNIQVSRRYKHFDWLHGRLEEKFALIPIPPLPDKQISGRYQDDFIEHRMAQLQMWVNRICRHPVLSECDVWKHFLLCTQEKTWKAGKRKAEKDELVGGQFFHCICPPSTNLDINTAEKETDKFGKFVSKMDDTVRQMFNIAQEQTKKHSGSYKREFQKISGSFKELGEAFEMDDSEYSNELTKAIKHTSSTYEDIGTMYEDQPKYDLEPLGDVLHEYKGMLASWPDVLHLQKSALIKRKEHYKLCEDGKLGADELASLNQRTDVIAYATLAEINHFHSERVAYFKTMMQTFLTAQIDFYQRIVQKLQESLVMYDNP